MTKSDGQSNGEGSRWSSDVRTSGVVGREHCQDKDERNDKLDKERLPEICVCAEDGRTQRAVEKFRSDRVEKCRARDRANTLEGDVENCAH